MAVVPDTQTWSPRRTAREYPTIGSQGVPLEKFWRLTLSSAMKIFNPNIL
jgi:hypothetical protein